MVTSRDDQVHRINLRSNDNFQEIFGCERSMVNGSFPTVEIRHTST